MTDALVIAALAAGVGAGLALVLRGLRRRAPDLATLLSQQSTIDDSRPTLGRAPAAAPDNLDFVQRMLGRWGMRVLEAMGMAERRQLQDRLRILGHSMERHAYEKMLAALAGLLIPSLLGFALGRIGSPLPPGLVLLAALGLGVGGFFYPDLTLADRVAERQSAFRHALAGYLDLVSIILAGGGGIESALSGAAEAGDGWVFAELRAALRRGELTGRPPWDMFEEVGARLGITELQELAASMALAGGHGARVRRSLTAKSEALRSQQSSEVEAKAESATEKMVVPVTIMVLGLMIFIGYGAAVAVMATSPAG